MQETFKDLANTILKREIRGETLIVGIGGPGGAGKSTFAKHLQREISGSTVLHGDDFAEPTTLFERHGRLEAVLKSLHDGETATWQRYDWDAKKLAENHTTKPGGVVIVEGVVSTRPEWKKYLTYQIWVDAPPELRLKRGLERDGQDAEGQWHEWMKEEDGYVAEHHPERYADLVVDGSGSEASIEHAHFRVIARRD